MKSIGSYLIIFLCALILWFCFSYENKDTKYYNSWLQEEIINSRYIVKALDERQKAVKISNHGPPGIMNESEFNQMRFHLQEALKYSELVRDDILDKIHPELKMHFRNEFQEGLKLQLIYLNKINNDLYYEIKGSTLQNSWTDWYNCHRKEIKIRRAN